MGIIKCSVTNFFKSLDLVHVNMYIEAIHEKVSSHDIYCNSVSFFPHKCSIFETLIISLKVKLEW